MNVESHLLICEVGVVIGLSTEEEFAKHYQYEGHAEILHISFRERLSRL